MTDAEKRLIVAALAISPEVYTSAGCLLAQSGTRGCEDDAADMCDLKIAVQILQRERYGADD